MIFQIQTAIPMSIFVRSTKQSIIKSLSLNKLTGCGNMSERDNILGELHQGGYSDNDIRLGQLLTRRALENHYNLGLKIRSCTSCNLCNAPVTGTGPWNSPLMIIGNSPTEIDSKYDTPFIGAEGQLLSFVMAKAGVDRNSIYMTYALKCSGHGDIKDQLEICHHHLVNEIEAIVPKVILTFGDIAMSSIRKNNDIALSEQVGIVHNLDVKTLTGVKQVKVIHTYSLSSILQSSSGQQEYKQLVWNHLKLAIALVKELAPNFNYDRVQLNNLEIVKVPL
jgi:uracil-DNA glycosylase family 4